MSIRFPLVTLLALPLLLTAYAGCGDSEEVDLCTPKEEGKYEVGGPSCCAGGCGASVEAPGRRICKSGEFKCEGSAPVLMQHCAYQYNACTRQVACLNTVGTGKSEELLNGGKVADLCCDLNCNGKKAAYRMCAGGVTFECPTGYVPVSRCKDPMSACQGLLNRYRANGYKIPADML